MQSSHLGMQCWRTQPYTPACLAHLPNKTILTFRRQWCLPPRQRRRCRRLPAWTHRRWSRSACASWRSSSSSSSRRRSRLAQLPQRLSARAPKNPLHSAPAVHTRSELPLPVAGRCLSPLDGLHKSIVYACEQHSCRVLWSCDLPDESLAMVPLLLVLR